MAQKKEYVASREVERAREAVRAHEQARPGEYRSEYDQALKEAMDRILNQKDFQYRLNGDTLYRQYRSQAVRDARRAMSDTMGQAAALAGGYGSSYAQAVGQQAYARQLEGLADRIPELYSLAMEQYKLQTQGLRDKYDLLAGAQGVLGCFNLLPILPLDGGRMLWLALCWRTDPFLADRMAGGVSLAAAGLLTAAGAALAGRSPFLLMTAVCLLCCTAGPCIKRRKSVYASGKREASA